MAQIPRTPVHWPRMKIRGRRNKAKAAQRIRREMLMPNVIAHFNPDGTVGIQPSLGRPQVGLMTVKTIAYVDGFGRPAPHVGLHEYHLAPVKPVQPARPEPAPGFGKLSFSTSFTVESDTSGLLDVLMGRERDGT